MDIGSCSYYGCSDIFQGMAMIKKLLTAVLISIIILQGLMLRNCYLVINEYNARIGEYVEHSIDRSEELEVINEQLITILDDEIERREE